MSRIGPKNTAPELAVRRRLHALGYRYRLHARTLPGRPDLAFPALRKILFVHGCFWHGHDCPHGRRRPKSNVQFWETKRIANVERDRRKRELLLAAGWRVMELWECDVKAGKWETSVVRFLGPREKGVSRRPSRKSKHMLQGGTQTKTAKGRSRMGGAK